MDVSFISWNIIDADAIKKNIPVRRVQKSSNDVQNRWFARTRRPQQSIELSFFQLEINIFQDDSIIIFKNFWNVFKLDDWFFQLS